MRRLTVLVILMLAGGVVTAPSADASFPGSNGKIAFYDFLEFFLHDRPTQIYAVDPDGTGRVRLTSGARFAGDPAWSAGGTQLALASERRGRKPHGRIETVTFDGSDRTVVAKMGARVYTSEPAWSPDGTQIAFCTTRASGRSSIFVVDSDGTGLTRLSDPGEDQCSPDWSPNGSQIVFTSASGRGGTLLGIMDATPGSQHDLFPMGGNNNWPSWSPNGDAIAFSRWTKRSDQRDIFVIDPMTEELTRITDTTRWEWTPAWSPDGNRIAFGRSRTLQTQSDIWTVAADGTDPVRVTQTDRKDEFQLTWQPTGP